MLQAKLPSQSHQEGRRLALEELSWNFPWAARRRESPKREVLIKVHIGRAGRGGVAGEGKLKSRRKITRVGLAETMHRSTQGQILSRKKSDGRRVVQLL